MARAQRKDRRARRRPFASRRRVLLAAGALALAAAGGVGFALLSGGSSPSTAVPVATTSQPLARLAGHPLLAPECAPIKGPEWVYPLGPPVRGLPPVVANIRSNLYEVFAIHYSCAKASAWIRKLYHRRIPIRWNGNVTVLDGPPGYYCSAYPDAHGLAYAGGCQSKGGGGCVVGKVAAGRPYANGRGCKLTGGDKAFGWNWNVANRRVVFAHDAKGVLHLFHVSGADTNVMFRYLPNAYELQVLNTSGIGYLNGFTWVPSPGWKVTKLTSVKGASCTLSTVGAGKITCKGSVDPPTCLCTGDGGMVSITFTAVPTRKQAGYLFGGSPWQFKITKMTPVPYLIPGTPDEAAKRDGV
ncbi:MAG TPA: hypothetical protein VKV21_04285 [Solirubrobacteraceae bacterium]|jgi:hypothetical protein|nr:hypothetical protein [Solirubrobacteraceae bacterium]